MEGAERSTSFLSGRKGGLWALLLILVTGVSVATESYVVAAIPFVILMVAWAFYSLDSLLLFLVAITPLSVTLKDQGFNVGLSLPSELILAGITLFLFFAFFTKWPTALERASAPFRRNSCAPACLDGLYCFDL